jgi:hypothetical protein
MSEPAYRLDLPALDGANPLGFLAALGTLAVLSETDPALRLGWKRGPRWTAFLQGVKELNAGIIVQVLADKLRGDAVAPAAENKRKTAQQQFDQAKKKLKKAEDELKQLKLRGKERDQEWEAKVKPLEQARNQARSNWLAALKNAVPSRELALGQRLDCTIAEFREHIAPVLFEPARNNRTATEFFAALGVEVSTQPDDRIHPTPFCFITGGSRRSFLDSARQLMARGSEAKVKEALFEPWAYRDEKFAMC